MRGRKHILIKSRRGRMVGSRRHSAALEDGIAIVDNKEEVFVS